MLIMRKSTINGVVYVGLLDSLATYIPRILRLPTLWIIFILALFSTNNPINNFIS